MPAPSNTYSCEMSALQENGRARYRVSARGQLSLPADARRRWGLEDGGEVEVFDLGRCLVMVPTQDGPVRKRVAEALDAARYAAYVASIEDPDLRDE